MLLLTVVVGLLAVRAIQPHVSQEAATTNAIRQLQQMNPTVTGYVLLHARYDPAPDKIYDDNGNLIGSESRSVCRLLSVQVPLQFCHTSAAWILHLGAPAQGGYASYEAYVAVNATDGTVSSASLTSH